MHKASINSKHEAVPYAKIAICQRNPIGQTEARRTDKDKNTKHLVYMKVNQLMDCMLIGKVSNVALIVCARCMIAPNQSCFSRYF